MPFEQAHQSFIENHHARRTGERKGRLLRGHNYAEKLLLQQVWWPLFGNFDNLHPEYEIYDWNRKSQYKDIILHSDVNFRTARKWLYCLVEKGILRSITRGKYTCYYELKEGAWQHLI
ncbi:hypothetical protein GC098_19910 [Paenibacillus sp. LMG 31458]|uniref:Transcriptional regulator n=1 Tax=Paenibacillus phytorum TaxID=2654977 RepID=A0ABX1Y0V9_9BACL|nr:hypothetical protein [Paenibacillus phytorum]NOU73658.1 hypothetical protein [Paenibacillus phytorum]